MAIKAKWIRLDERLNAIDYLLRTSEFINKTKQDKIYWKWVCLGLHGAIYGFSICACQNSDGSSVVQKNRDGNDELISFGMALKRCQNHSFVSCPLALTSEQVTAIEKIKGIFRDQFVHFQPKGWSIEIHGFPQLAIHCLEVIRQLAFQVKGRPIFNTYQEKKIKSIIHNSLYDLKALKL